MPPLNINRFGQTRDWEEACLEGRRNLRSRERRLKMFAFKPDQKILDLGCGDGLNIKILRSLEIDNVVGADISRMLLKRAQKINPETKFILASAEKLPFRAHSFDVVLVDSVFHHLLAYQEALKEIKRVLRPRGKLCFVEPHRSIWRSLYDFVTLLPISRQLPFLSKRRKSLLGEMRFMSHWLQTEDAFLNALRKLQFKKIKLDYDILSVIGVYQIR